MWVNTKVVYWTVYSFLYVMALILLNNILRQFADLFASEHDFKFWLDLHGLCWTELTKLLHKFFFFLKCQHCLCDIDVLWVKPEFSLLHHRQLYKLVLINNVLEKLGFNWRVWRTVIHSRLRITSCTDISQTSFTSSGCESRWRFYFVRKNMRILLYVHFCLDQWIQIQLCEIAWQSSCINSLICCAV